MYIQLYQCEIIFLLCSGATTNDVGGDGTLVSLYVEDDVHYIG